ncbi:conjugative transposon protein TraJ [Algoriphagus sp. C2-6-M1]|uniref:conjugative transposon protein TraJ n=1 Tax=Algoriphagus persicinus TaxID=3108754 RepID=UPI002B3CB612|nr:conjugative transposon protein TraJ [Algoriphagus sp. C2-6-M1]MEB2782189.1 conjugative transposon protein TraJ [Algoriphagus sp. C2-6-M1]
MKKLAILLVGIVFLLTGSAHAQTISGSVEGLHEVLDQLYDEMIPLANGLITFARAVAGFAAIWYISMRVWGHIARSEPIDMYPLLRPFAIGIAIMLFPQVLAVMNGTMNPIIRATSQMVEGTNLAIANHIYEMEAEQLEPYINPISESGEQKYPENLKDMGVFERIANEVFVFNLKAIVSKLISEFLQMLFFAAALCVNTIRTFQLIVLSILGPLVFGLSVFDGFQHTMAAWFARYINISMWLPVANIFGAIIAKIQLNMMVLDGDFTASVGYLVFMVIAIIGYMTVPNVAGFIVQPGGRDSLLNSATSAAKSGALGGTRVIQQVIK